MKHIETVRMWTYYNKDTDVIDRNGYGMPVFFKSQAKGEDSVGCFRYYRDDDPAIVIVAVDVEMRIGETNEGD